LGCIVQNGRQGSIDLDQLSVSAAHLRRIFGWADKPRPWSMTEVFVFGALVAQSSSATCWRPVH
jgi:hypothetical protein